MNEIQEHEGEEESPEPENKDKEDDQLSSILEHDAEPYASNVYLTQKASARALENVPSAANMLDQSISES